MMMLGANIDSGRATGRQKEAANEKEQGCSFHIKSFDFAAALAWI
jgi:hypothetical protein